MTDGCPPKKERATEQEKTEGTSKHPPGCEIAEDGVLQYRTSAISMYQHKMRDMETEEQEPSTTQEEQLAQTSDRTKTQNTVQLEEH